MAGCAAPYAAVLIGLYGLRSAWCSILLYHLGIVACLLAARERHMLREALAGFAALPLVALGAGCLLAGPLVYVLWPVMELRHGGLAGWLAEYGLAGRSWPVFMVYFAFVHAWLEELFWRGFLRRPGAGVSALDMAFAGYHILVLRLVIRMPWPLVAFAVLAGAAWTWRRITGKYGGLAVPLITHVVADISVMLAAHVLAR
ncbi:MAG: CPBP family intramembrane metalloprotease [Kiritimatiellae bacterium]|nr:CPBP family intramembrane metalloprotease [Kiritimatiellia bacterium]